MNIYVIIFLDEYSKLSDERERERVKFLLLQRILNPLVRNEYRSTLIQAYHLI